MPVWESEKVLERKPLFRSLQSNPTSGWIAPLQSSPCNGPKKIRILKLLKNHRSASPITLYFKEPKLYKFANVFLISELLAPTYILSSVAIPINRSTLAITIWKALTRESRKVRRFSSWRWMNGVWTSDPGSGCS